MPLHSLQHLRLVPPRVSGSSVEDIEVIEGSTLSLQCEVEAHPDPTYQWNKDGYGLPDNLQLLADNATVYTSQVTERHEGSYFCKVRNEGGVAEKTFNVKVILKPRMSSSEVFTQVRMNHFAFFPRLRQTLKYSSHAL